MKTSEWLKSTPLVKVTNSLRDWTRDDLISLAVQEFNTTDLSKMQLIQLISKLKEGIRKPARAVDIKVTPVPVGSKVRLVSNPSHIGDKTEWYWAGTKPALRFSSHEDIALWATTLLMKDTTRSNWSGILKDWYKKTDLKTYDSGLWPVPETAECTRLVERYRKARKASLMPLPDNDTLNRRYWSLGPGDALQGPFSKWSVTNVKLTMDGPPVVSLEELKETNVESMQAVPALCKRTS